MTKKKPETATDRRNAAEIKRATRKKADPTVTDAGVNDNPTPATVPDTPTPVQQPAVTHAYHVGGYDFVA